VPSELPHSSVKDESDEMSQTLPALLLSRRDLSFLLFEWLKVAELRAASPLDKLATTRVEQLHLPMPSDRRLRQIADRLTDDLSERTTIPEWARQVGMSKRALRRVASKETGMSFGRWRRQFQIMLALKQLSEGDSVQTVAFALGYESSSAFVVGNAKCN